MDVTGIVLIVVGAVGLGAIVYGFSQRSENMLRRWAAEHGYELLRAEFRMFRKGPFIWSSRSQVVYRIEVRDAEGNTHAGWARCGSWWLGLAQEMVETRWDDESIHREPLQAKRSNQG